MKFMTLAEMQDEANKEKKVLGENLKRLRIAKGLSREEFAEMFNISTLTVRNTEQGYISPRNPAIIKYADFYGASLDDIFGRGDYSEKIILAYQLKIAKSRIGNFIKFTDSNGVDGMIHIDYSDVKDFLNGARVLFGDNSPQKKDDETPPSAVSVVFTYRNFVMFYNKIVFRALYSDKTFEGALYDQLKFFFFS